MKIEIKIVSPDKPPAMKTEWRTDENCLPPIPGIGDLLSFGTNNLFEVTRRIFHYSDRKGSADITVELVVKKSPV